MKYVDPTGEEMGDFYDRKGNYLGNDGEQDGKTYLLKEGFRANTENKDVNWGGTVEKKHADQLKNKSDEVGGLIIIIMYPKIQTNSIRKKRVLLL